MKNSINGIRECYSLKSVRVVQKIELKLLLICTIRCHLILIINYNHINEIYDVKSLTSIIRLTPGFWLNPLKCRTARFTGCVGRLALLLSEYVEASSTACKYTKKTVQQTGIKNIMQEISMDIWIDRTVALFLSRGVTHGHSTFCKPLIFFK